MSKDSAPNDDDKAAEHVGAKDLDDIEQVLLRSDVAPVREEDADTRVEADDEHERANRREAMCLESLQWVIHLELFENAGGNDLEDASEGPDDQTDP